MYLKNGTQSTQDLPNAPKIGGLSDLSWLPGIVAGGGQHAHHIQRVPDRSKRQRCFQAVVLRAFLDVCWGVGTVLALRSSGSAKTWPQVPKIAHKDSERVSRKRARAARTIRSPSCTRLRGRTCSGSSPCPPACAPAGPAHITRHSQQPTKATKMTERVS